MSRAWWWVFLVTGCGGSSQAATSPPESAPPKSQAAATADTPEADPADVAAEKPAAPSKDAKPSDEEPKPGDASGDPAFPDNASVSDAMALVPKGTSRSNIDPERLGEPLGAEAVYAPCRVGSQHFKLRVAVWRGRAVGVDVKTSNKALASCIDKQVRGIEWPDKVRSLNTVDYSM